MGDLLSHATAGFFAGAAAGGAVSSTIMGADPGVGTLYALAGAGIAYSFPSVRASLGKFQAYLDGKIQQSTTSLAVHVSDTRGLQGCLPGPSCPVGGSLAFNQKTGAYDLTLFLRESVSGKFTLNIFGRPSLTSPDSSVYRLGNDYLMTVEISGTTVVRGIPPPPPLSVYGQPAPIYRLGYIHLVDPVGGSRFQVPGFHSRWGDRIPTYAH